MHVTQSIGIMKKIVIIFLLMVIHFLSNAQIVVTLRLQDPCASVTSILYQPPATLDLVTYPNPTSGLLTIELPEAMIAHPTLIEIFNVLGEKLESVRLVGSREVIIDLTGRPPGLYIISATSGNTKTHQRVIKQ